MQTITIILEENDKFPEIGEVLLDARLTLGEETLHNPSQEAVMQTLSIPDDSNARWILEKTYSGMLAKGEEPNEMGEVVRGSRMAIGIDRVRGVELDEQQKKFVYHAALDHPLIYLDSGAGCGKTTTICFAIERCLEMGDSGTRVILAAATNAAVAVGVRKLEEMTTSEVKPMRFLAKRGEETTRSDLQRLMLDLDEEEPGTPEMLKARIRKMREDVEELQEVEARFPDKESMTGQMTLRVAELEKEIRENIARSTSEMLEVKGPNVIALTLDSLIARLQGGRDAVKSYIQGASEVFVFVDEASQASEAVLVSLASLLPNAFVRYVGDPAQLEPHCLVEQVDFDRAWGARGIASVLAQSRGCPRVTLRMNRRMHAGINVIPSMLFYEGTLQSAVANGDRASPFALPVPLFPWVWADTKGMEVTAPSGSRFNMEETRVAGRLAREMAAHGGSVLLLVFYKEHARVTQQAFPDLEVR